MLFTEHLFIGFKSGMKFSSYFQVDVIGKDNLLKTENPNYSR